MPNLDDSTAYYSFTDVAAAFEIAVGIAIFDEQTARIATVRASNLNFLGWPCANQFQLDGL